MLKACQIVFNWAFLIKPRTIFAIFESVHCQKCQQVNKIFGFTTRFIGNIAKADRLQHSSLPLQISLLVNDDQRNIPSPLPYIHSVVEMAAVSSTYFWPERRHCNAE